MSETNTLPGLQGAGLRVRVALGWTQVVLEQDNCRDIQPHNKAGEAGVGQTGFSASVTSRLLESWTRPAPSTQLLTPQRNAQETEVLLCCTLTCTPELFLV